MRHLQIQGLAFQAAEQFSTLVVAAAAHESATAKFFDAYVEHVPLGRRIEDARSFSRADISRILGEPSDAASARADLEARGLSTPDTVGSLLDPAHVRTSEVGGVSIPDSVIEDAVLEKMVAGVREIVDLTKTNLDQGTGPAVQEVLRQPLIALTGWLRT